LSIFKAGILMGLAVCLLTASPASRLYKEGRLAEKEGRYGAAYLLYSRAYALNPRNVAYRARAEAIRRQGILQLDMAPAGGAGLAGTPGPSEPSPNDPSAGEILNDGGIDEEEALRPPPVLIGASGKRDFHLEGDVKVLWKKVLEPYGLEAVFDADLTPGKPVKFELSGADWRTAVRALESVTGTFIVPLGDRLGMVVKETVQKRSEMERHMTASIPIPNTLSPQETQEVAQAVRSVFDIQKFAISSSRGMAFLKDRASRVKPAGELFKQLVENRA